MLHQLKSVRAYVAPAAASVPALGNPEPGTVLMVWNTTPRVFFWALQLMKWETRGCLFKTDGRRAASWHLICVSHAVIQQIQQIQQPNAARHGGAPYHEGPESPRGFL